MLGPPPSQLIFDVAGTPVASPGRIDKNPFSTGLTPVTFKMTAVAPTGTTTASPVLHHLNEVRRLYGIGTSMQCYVDPEEIADLIVISCSDHGRHISGQTIGVDGHTETLWPRS